MKRHQLFSLLLGLFIFNQASGQCVLGLSPNLGFADVTSCTNCQALTYCGITLGAWIGNGSTPGTVVYAFNPPTSYVEVDFNALSTTPTVYEYLEFWINGSFYDLNNATATFTTGLPGCATNTVSFVTSPGNLGNSGISGVIEALADNGAGTVKIDFNCEINTIEIKNQNVGASNGSVFQVRRCLDNATGNGNCTCSLISTIASVNIACFGGANGAASAVPTNGTPPYTYVWSNSSNNPSINGLSAGTYTVTITDAAGCVEINQTTITQPSALNVTVNGVNVPCSGGTGSATATAAGGTAGYTYAWSNGQSTPTILGLSAGNYTVTVTDVNGCEQTGSVMISGGGAISLSVTDTDVSCFGEKDGNATATPVGGTPPYLYDWSDGQATMTAISLDPGTYTVTITDAAGCTEIGNATITEPNRMDIFFSVENVGCDSLDDGSIMAVNDNGVPPFTYKWDAATGNQTTQSVSNLALGNYKLTMTDSNGCESVAGVIMNQEDCEPCPIDPCVEAVLNNTNICTAIANDPGDPLTTLDCDADGVTNADECTDTTDPLDPCDYEDTSITLPVTADQTNCPMPCPDLTPIMTILPGNIAGMSAVEVAVQLTELDSVDTNGSIVMVRIPSDPRLVFVWNIGLTQAALVPVQNSDWNYLGNNGIFHAWTYNGPGLVIPAEGVTAFGFQSFYDPQATDGQTTLTVTVIPFSGGECNILNNTDSERLVYFE